MKRYHVITHTIGTGEHISIENLLPASCTHITGVFATANGKKTVELNDCIKELSFPLSLYQRKADEQLRGLFYSYLRSRSTAIIASDVFNDQFLQSYIDCFCDVEYTNHDNATIKNNISNAIHGINGFDQSLNAYLFNDVGVYESELTDDKLITLMINESIQFLYDKREQIFYTASVEYSQSQSFEVGNISALVNGNLFILRDYTIAANRKLRPIEKEVIPLNEPLKVNSSIKMVFKNSIDLDVTDDLTVKIYIQYEHKRTTA